MHTVWKGSISFGLVNIPVKLHAQLKIKMSNCVSFTKTAIRRLAIKGL